MTLGLSPGGADPGIDWLGEHDLDVLTTLSVVRVASSNQLARLHFADASTRACQRCLARLSRGRLIARLARRVGGISPGSEPWAYSLASAGQRLLGVAGPRGGRVRPPAQPSPTFLRHALLVTEVYVVAVEVSHQPPRQPMSPSQFATEPECWRRLPDGTWLKPDAELRLAGEGYEDLYLIEADTGTQGQTALGHKLDQYRQLYQAGTEQARTGIFPQVLFVTLKEPRMAYVAAQIARQPKEVQPIFAVIHLPALTGLLTWGPQAGEENEQ